MLLSLLTKNIKQNESQFLKLQPEANPLKCEILRQVPPFFLHTDDFMQ
jgi:hypothetical protein